MKLTLLVLFLPLFLFSISKAMHVPSGVEVPYQPWFTGPLLAPTPINLKLGHPAIEPAVIVSYNYGAYDLDWGVSTTNQSWSINPLIDFQFATSHNTGIELIIGSITSFIEEKNSTHFQDTLVLFGYQVSEDQKDSWVPDFRLLLDVVFPTGKHDKLDPGLGGIDVTGQGAYFVGTTFSFRKLFYLPSNYFALQWSFAYLFPTRAHFKGPNAYGGAHDTKGSILPGQSLSAFISGEYSFNQQWGFAFDSSFTFQRETRHFKGRAGTLPSGQPASVGVPWQAQISFAPALEYNFSANAGLLFGAWLTLAGRNTDAFASAFLAYLHIF